MKLKFALTKRARRLGVAAVALMIPATGLAAVATSPAQAGGVNMDNGILTAAVYNNSPFDFKPAGMYSQYSWGSSGVPDDVVSSGGASLFALAGSEPFPIPWCADKLSRFNGWFSYEADLYHGATEFLTISIHGDRKTAGCSAETWPAIDVWQTSTKVPATWRWHDGPPPNVVSKPLFKYTHNTPYWLDQTFEWIGDGPGVGQQSIVSLGDSTISGEGGRWAGNTNVSNGRDDAGSTWYWDTSTGEEIQDCHRSKSAEVHIGTSAFGSVQTKNLACSAAETVSYEWLYPQGWRWKPGVDLKCAVKQVYPFEDPNSGPLSCRTELPGQLYSLYHYAIHHNVKAVLVAVGANDFDFSGVTKQCMEYYFSMHEQWQDGHIPDTCADQAFFQEAISIEKKNAIEQKIWTSLANLTYVMDAAGYDKSDYTVVLQNYWSAIPNDADIRIADTGFDRSNKGGCPILDGDGTPLNTQLLKAINDTVFKVATRFRAEPYWPELKLMDVSDAFRGHRLCERNVGLIEDIASFTGKGTDPSVASKLEWVTQARIGSALDPAEPYTLAEGGHANYWGQLAERNCLRQMYEAIIRHDVYAPGDPLRYGGKCVPAIAGVNAAGEPMMTLASLQSPYRW